MGERSYWEDWLGGESFKGSEGELSSGGGCRGLDESVSEGSRVRVCFTQNG